MANFTKDDLAFTGYSQKIDLANNPEHSEILDGMYIDKTEEIEVIHFCNQFLEKYKVPQTKKEKNQLCAKPCVLNHLV